jgi:hypothetical protein
VEAASVCPDWAVASPLWVPDPAESVEGERLAEPDWEADAEEEVEGIAEGSIVSTPPSPACWVVVPSSLVTVVVVPDPVVEPLPVVFPSVVVPPVLPPAVEPLPEEPATTVKVEPPLLE